MLVMGELDPGHDPLGPLDCFASLATRRVELGRNVIARPPLAAVAIQKATPESLLLDRFAYARDDVVERLRRVSSGGSATSRG